ncbi:Phosphopantothenoylcysteine decarboxylase [Danaus plexippus plexippus]|uniref:Phosphopantothenoylcysteine decarboxylase n=1 Tax=Danaus plexippus plexippus TaxID=278856 RepID=A0A212FCL2_DANPL|nr:Phosphopantothenoylcysteine decarboxylase [Danaus plexippus plexippus]
MEKKLLNIIIGVTGSVATIKLPLIIENLLNITNVENGYKFEIQVICTERSKHFFKITDIPECCSLFDDDVEWSSWNHRGDPVLHIELGKWADMLVIAPLDANTLAKISQGICDNLLTCTVRAWDVSKPLLFCPAMNTRMYQHPITANQIETLKAWGYKEIPSIEKKLMCGDTGIGAMADVDTIVQKIHSTAQDHVNNKKD